jgi:hypothetical protein
VFIRTVSGLKRAECWCGASCGLRRSLELNARSRLAVPGLVQAGAMARS